MLPWRSVLALLLLIATASVAIAQVDPKTALLEKAGWDALAAGRAHEAADAFRDALAGDPRNARLHLGAGAAAYAERRDSDARVEFTRALELDPRLNDARMLLSRVQYRMGDVRAAISTLELLVAVTPEQAANARATLDRWRRETELHDRMQQVVGDRFTISFEGPAEEALAAEALSSLDRAYWRIGSVLGAFPTQPIVVVLYTAEQFQDITRAPWWAAGAYDGTIRVPMRGALAKPSELDRILAHEFTHALVRSLASRGVPAWLNEGLAAALESDEAATEKQGSPSAGQTVPLQALAAGFSRMSGAEAELAYATSERAVRRLIDEAGGAAIVNLLRDLSEGAGFDAAFLHRVQRSFADFQAGGF